MKKTVLKRSVASTLSFLMAFSTAVPSSVVYAEESGIESEIAQDYVATLSQTQNGTTSFVNHVELFLVTKYRNLCRLINTDVSFISLDPKRLSIMIMKTKSTAAIKSLLNQLFQRNRKGLWNSYDTSIAISYLIQSEFRHIDLLAALNENSANLKNYYYYCCENCFLSTLRNRRIN